MTTNISAMLTYVYKNKFKKAGQLAYYVTCSMRYIMGTQLAAKKNEIKRKEKGWQHVVILEKFYW